MRQVVLRGATIAWSWPLAFLLAACTASRPADRIHAHWMAGIDSLAVHVSALATAPDSLPIVDIQRRFAAARLAYKRIEFLNTYFEPSTSRTLNGPALPRVEDEEGPEAVFPPEGFQVIEELLYSAPTDPPHGAVRDEAGAMLELVTRLRTAAAGIPLTDAAVWDAAKLGIARLATTGISGFDSPVALASLDEGAATLEGMRDALYEYAPRAADRSAPLHEAFGAAIAALKAGTTFDDFDRLAFIATRAHPLAHALRDARRQLDIDVPLERRGFRMEAASLFDADAIDPMGFAMPGTAVPSPEQIALGASLFADRRLSDGASRSCTSCHRSAHAFAEPRARSVTRDGRAVLRNAPTIINVGLQLGTFHDLRTTWLEDQVVDVIGNPDEMHGNFDEAVAALARDTVLQARFDRAYPGAGLTGPTVRSALAAYMRSLVSLDTRVDRAMRGELTQLDSVERRGFNLFHGKAKCATCHFAPLYNGTVPPMFAESEVEVLGVPERPVWQGARVDPDVGRFRITRAEPHRFAFRTPTVRELARTAPYMHNGVFQTLEEVIRFYDVGGGAGIGIDLPNQTLPADSLKLTPDDQRALVRFLLALSSAPHAPLP